MSANAQQTRIGGFRIVKQLGGGAQGGVFSALCVEKCIDGVEVGDTVALKKMAVAEGDTGLLERSQRMIEALKRLGHANIVKYYGCFEVADLFGQAVVVVMEFLQGETLADWMKSNPGGLEADEALWTVYYALDALAAAESASIVHRDVKPSNIFICGDGTVKLIDFEDASEEGARDKAGGFAGTFDYMAPEFVDPAFRADAISDVFSMGVVLHEALTGKLPYREPRGKDEPANFAYMRRWTGDAKAIHISDKASKLLSGVNEVMKKAVSPDRAFRYAGAAQFRDAIRHVRFRDLTNKDGGRKYRLLTVIGRGGFGEVFKARVRGTNPVKYVAVKRMNDSSYGERFRRERNVMMKLDDPSFVRLYDYFEVQDKGAFNAFLIMDFLPGMPGASLRDAIKRREGGGIELDKVCEAFAIYAKALALMHAQKIYHRDIKPSNLYFPEWDVARSAIMDLGIARDMNVTLTTGNVPGTLDYMPPEIVTVGERGDEKMDIYALGLCLYEAATGKLGYSRLPTGQEESIRAFYTRARSGIPPNFDDPSVTGNPALARLLMEMTAVDKARRLGDAMKVAKRLRIILEDLRKTKRPRTVSPFPVPKVGEAPASAKAASTPTQATGATYSDPSLQELAPGKAKKPATIHSRIVSPANKDAPGGDNPSIAPKPPMPASRERRRPPAMARPHADAQRAARARPSPYSQPLAPYEPPANDQNTIPKKTPGSSVRDLPDAEEPPYGSDYPIYEDGESFFAVHWKLLCFLALVGMLAIAAALCWRSLSSAVSGAIVNFSEWRRIQQASSLRDSERARVEAARAKAGDGIADVVAAYSSRDVSLLAVDAKADAWLLEYGDNEDTRELAAEATQKFAEARASRVERDRSEELNRLRKLAEGEARRILADYEDPRKSVVDSGAHAEAWKTKWKSKIPEESIASWIAAFDKAFATRAELDRRSVEERKNAEIARREREKAREALAKAAEDVAARYASRDVALSACNAAYAAWQADWGRYSGADFYAAARRRIEEARSERTLAESGRRVAEECSRWLDGIESLGAAQVRNWRSNIDQAQICLVRAKGEGRISAAAAAGVQAKIDECAKWVVGYVDNRTAKKISFVDLEVPPYSGAIAIFRHGVPDGVAVSSEGCVPYGIRKERIDGNVITVKEGQLRESRASARAIVPSLEPSVVCFVDGVKRKQGEIAVGSGGHKVTYRNTASTYPGIRDWADQNFDFEVGAGGRVNIPAYSRNWTHTGEFEAKKANARLVAEGERLAAKISDLLVPEPIGTRRARLAEAYSILTDWQTPQALAQVGERAAAELRARYDAENARVRGYIRNGTAVAARVAVPGGGEFAIAPGTRALVTFEKGYAPQTPVMFDNYEFVLLPQTAGEFDGGEFAINPSRLVPAPVEVAVPPLEDDVVCSIDGERVESLIKLRPRAKPYQCAYSKPDCVRQTIEFSVKPGESITLPSPQDWQPSGALSNLAEALASFNDGAIGKAKQIVAKVGDIEDAGKRRELQELKHAIELREKLNARK